MTAKKPIVIDVCVGSACMYQTWHKNLGDSFISMDVRKGDYSFDYPNRATPKTVIVKPKILADMKHMPFKDGVADIINCDPPHYACGITGFLNKLYGSWNQEEVKESIKWANQEFARVLRDGGQLNLKIMPSDINTYQNLLSNFTFYWPIQTYRPSGIVKGTRKEQNAATVLLGVKTGCSNVSLDEFEQYQAMVFGRIG